MNTFLEYIYWFKDLNFSKKEFNEIDMMILSYFAYLDLEKVLPNNNEKSLSLCVNELSQYVKLNDNVKLVFKDDSFEDFAKALADSTRFGTLLISDFIDAYDENKNLQFCAFSYKYISDNPNDNFTAICFRGTDNTIIGWKEDFMLSFSLVKAQKLALKYCVENIKDDCKYYIGGHSKGGNLALYAACLLNKNLFEKVLKVYLLDSPGLCPEIIDPNLIKKIDEKIISISPEYSVVGKIFEPNISNEIIVKSIKLGLAQHQISSWCIKYGKLDTIPTHDPASIAIGNTLDKWLENIEMENRQKVVDEIFDALSSGNATTINDIYSTVKSFEQVVSSLFNISQESKETVTNFPKELLKNKTKFPMRYHFNNVIKFIKSNTVVQYLIIALLILITLIIPAENIFFFTYILVVTILILIYHNFKL